MGLIVVKPTESHPGANYTLDDFESGSTNVIGGAYVSDCCMPRVTIVASDLLGNAGRCHVDYIPVMATVPPTEVVPARTTKAKPSRASRAVTATAAVVITVTSVTSLLSLL